MTALVPSAKGLAAQPGQIAGLTSIRGIAAWWIVLYHFREAFPARTPAVFVNFLNHGYLAVDLFFELSGFVIALNYADQMLPATGGGVARFLGLRLARIYPLHLAMLLAFLMNPLAIWVHAPHAEIGDRYNPVYFLLSLLLVQNWGFTRDLAWNVPAWSISTEWLAYLLFPLMLLILRRPLRQRTTSFMLSIGMLVILAFLTPVFGASIGSDIPHFGPLRCVLEFWSGACLWSFRSTSQADGPIGRIVPLLLSATLIGLDVEYAIPDFVLVPLAFLFLVWAMSFRAGWVARIMGGRTIGFLGMISYSTYMAHYFVRDWVKFLIVPTGTIPSVALPVYLLCTLILSFALYYIVEVPGRRMLRQLSARSANRPA